MTRSLHVLLSVTLFSLISCGDKIETDGDTHTDTMTDPVDTGTNTDTDTDTDTDTETTDTDTDTDTTTDTETTTDTGGDTGTPADFSDYNDFDEEQIIWLHTDVSDWDVTSTVTGGHITYSQLCVYHTMAGQWPKVYGIFPEDPEAPMEGNIWVIARVGGLWYAATFDYLRPGDECKYEDFSPSGEGPGPSTFGAVPLATWVPQSGEPVYMFMSTVARHEPLGPLNERSDYIRLIWP